MESSSKSTVDDEVLLGRLELLLLLLLGDLRRDHPLDALRPMLLEALDGAIPDQPDRIEGIHLRAESRELGDPKPARLIVYQPNLRLVALEVRQIVGVAGFDVGPLEQLDSVDHVLLDVLRLHFIHERVFIGEGELGIVHILGLQELVVEADGRHGTHEIVPMQKHV